MFIEYKGPMIFRFFILCGLFMLPVGSLQADNVENDAKLSRKLVNDIFQPLHSEFLYLSERLANDTVDLCERPSSSSTYKLQTDFTYVVEAYSAIEFFRLGPLLENNRKNRLFFWPDKRRVGERQLSSLLISSDAITITADQLAGKSVALQGFTALERLLFKASSFPLENSPQCHLISVVTRNIANMARELNTAWSTESDYVQSLLKPNAGSKHFRTSDEVVGRVFTQVKVGLDVLHDAKLAPLLSNDPKKMSRTPMWLSQRYIAMLTGNLYGIKVLLLDSGMIENTELHEDLSFEFKYIEHVFEKLKPMLYSKNDDGTLARDARILLNQIMAVVNGIRYVVNVEVAKSLGVSAGFNSEDGD